jgi:hypothetical protein
MRMLAVFTLILLLLAGCKNEPTTPTNGYSSVNPTTVIVEGTAFYFVGGGTVEHLFPPGYQLISSKWISPSTKPDTGFSIYLSSSIDSSYLNRRVRAFGTLDSIAVGWMFSNVVDYVWKIDVDSLKIMN